MSALRAVGYDLRAYVRAAHANRVNAHVKLTDFSSVTAQATLWTRGAEISTGAVMRLSGAAWKAFDGDPVILPSFAGLPAEIPRLTLKSSDDSWRLQFALNRVDLFARHVGTANVDLADFSSRAKEIFDQVLSLANGVQVVRLAYVLSRTAESKDPAGALARYFLRPKLLEGPLNRPADFQLHAHKVYAPAGMPTVNSWVRWRVGALVTTGVKVITVEQDLNTLAESDAVYDSTSVAAFIKAAPAEMDSILDLYLSYPPA